MDGGCFHACISLLKLYFKTRRGHKMFQKSYDLLCLQLCCVLCLQFSETRKSSSPLVPQTTKHSHCLPTSDKWKNKWSLAGNSGPRQRRAVALLCYSSKRVAGIRAKPVSAMSSEGMTPLMHCSEEEYLKILIVFQGISH